jgi:hypothetical protein
MVECTPPASQRVTRLCHIKVSERELNLLVGVVDAELLEAVDVERLEAVDVQYADEDLLLARLERRRLLVLLDVLVQRHYEPVEHARIEQHGQRVARALGLLLVHVDEVDLAAGHHLALQERLLHQLKVALK